MPQRPQQKWSILVVVLLYLFKISILFLPHPDGKILIQLLSVRQEQTQFR